MIYRTYIPSYPLSQIVNYFWYVNGNVDHPKEKILPAGNQELMINLSDDFQMDDKSGEKDKKCRQMWFSSVLTKPIIIHTSHTNVIAVNFKNTGAYSLFGFPLKEFNNFVTDMENIWYRNASEIRNRLLEEVEIEQKFLILELLLTQKLLNYDGMNKSVEYAINLMDSLDVKSISNTVGYTSKHLNSLFKKYMGISPKKLMRIKKFQTAIKLIGINKQSDLQEVAFLAGYFDHSHFIKDFKEFSEYTPSEYLKKEKEYTNFIPIF